MAHPAVKEAAVIAIPHPRWQKRPLALVVPVEGRDVTAQSLRDLLLKKFAKWQLPDEFVFVKELPHTSTGEVDQDGVAKIIHTVASAGRRQTLNPARI